MMSVLNIWLLAVKYALYFAVPYDYRGPLLAKLSDAYAGYYALRASLHLATFADHQRYGKVMRYGPNRLIFSSAAALRDIYQSPKSNKSRMYLFTLPQEGIPFIFNAIDPNLHSHKRRIVGTALSERSIHLFEPVLAEQIKTFLQQLLLSGSAPVNMTNRAQWLTMDVAGLLGFGFPLNLQTKDEYRFTTKTTTLNWRINTYMNFPFLGNLGLEHIFRLEPTRLKWRGMIEKMITTRLKQDRKAKHDFYMFVTEKLDSSSEQLQNTELFAESLNFMIAGGDTAGASIAALFFYLSRYPRCCEILQQEIRTTFQTGDEIRGGKKLSSCVYLRACIDEALRLSPPVSGTLWRERSDPADPEPWVVDGHVIPPGTIVGVNTYSIHHDERYFPEPFTFRPERWTETLDAKGTDADPGRAFVPFSIGTRSCLGKSLAYLESSIVAAKTLWYFDFERCAGPLGNVGAEIRGEGNKKVEEFRLYDVITARHDGPYLVFKPRDNFCEELWG